MKKQTTTRKGFWGFAALVLTCTLLSEGRGLAQVPGDLIPEAGNVEVVRVDLPFRASDRLAQMTSVLQVQAPPPVAKVRVLVALMSGPAIEGVVPKAKANFQAQLGESSLAVGASNLNLPDGTVLTVALNGTDVGAMIVLFGQGSLILDPAPAVHAGQIITISAGSSVILSGTFQAP